MSFRQDAAHLQKLANNAFCQTGTLAALADSGQPDPDKLQKALEQTAAQFESAALEVRKLCERYSTPWRTPGRWSCWGITGSISR